VNVKEMRQKPAEDLRREITAAEREIWKTKFQRGSEKAGDPNKVRTLRREVARMMTVLRERELGVERGAKKS
jgi:large subunit ribosomal protein L29